MQHTFIAYTDLTYVTIQTGYYCITFPVQSIHLREKSIAGPTERSKSAQALFKLTGQDLRFSMKMMFAPDSGTHGQPV